MPKTFIVPSFILDIKRLPSLLKVGGFCASFSLASMVLAQDVLPKEDALKLKLEDQLLVRPIVPDDVAPTFTSSKQLDGVMDRQMRLEDRKSVV
jgi:LPS-assembly protein